MNRSSWVRVYRPGFRAFSLLELLIVISLLAVLLSLLIGSFRGMEAATNTEICKSNMRITWRAFMDYKAEHGRIYSTHPQNLEHASSLMQQAANTVNVISSWGHVIVPNHLDYMPGPGVIMEGGANIRRRLPYCPEYIGDNVVGGNFFGHGIPRVLLIYGMYIDNIPEKTIGGIQGPTMDKILFHGDNYYPVFTSPTNIRTTFNGGYRMLQGIRHGRNRDSLNFLMANGTAYTLPSRNPSNIADGFGGYFNRAGFSNNRDRYAMFVDNNVYSRNLLPLQVNNP